MEKEWCNWYNKDRKNLGTSQASEGYAEIFDKDVGAKQVPTVSAYQNKETRQRFCGYGREGNIEYA